MYEKICILSVLLFCVAAIDGKEQTWYKPVAKPHKLYKHVMCYYPNITSMTKMRDNKYFISMADQKVWFVSETEEVNENNRRDLSSITKIWDKIDASFYYGWDMECGDSRHRDRLVLVNYNIMTKTNEVLIGSLRDWNWTLVKWYELNPFILTESHLNWSRSIDAIAANDDSVIIFQDQKYIAMNCEYDDSNGKWIFKIKEFMGPALDGPFDAAYFDDKQTDTIPLNIFRGDKYYLCYFKVFGEYFGCDEEIVSDNPLLPKEVCFVSSDPNETLLTSIWIQLLLKSLALLVVTVYAFICFRNIWIKLNNKSKAIENKDKNEIFVKDIKK